MWNLMRGWVSVLVLAFAVCAASVARSEEAAAPRWDADRVLKVINLVVQQHVDPPTKQSLVVAVLRSLEGENIPQLGIGRRVSMQDDQQLRTLLNDSIAVFQKKHGDDAVLTRLNLALVAAANSNLVGQESHQVEQSLKANRYVGIGIALGEKAGRLTMVKVIEGGPADLAGAKDGDQIVKVDGVSTDGMSVQQLVDVLRGPLGSEVDVALKRDAKQIIETKMRRNLVPFKHVNGFQIVEEGIAQVKVARVTSSIVRELRQLTPKIEEHEIRGLVIQLLGPESDYQAAVLFANALIPGGNIGGVQTADGIELVTAEEDSLWPELKIVILPRLKLSDSLAWAVSAMRLQGDVHVSGIPTNSSFRVNRSAWKFGTVDVSEDLQSSKEPLLLRVPVAKLLGSTTARAESPSANSVLRFYDFSNSTSQRGDVARPMATESIRKNALAPQVVDPAVNVVETLRRMIK